MPTGEVIASVVSTENQTDLGYTSPPGVFDNVSRQGGDRETAGTQINEKSLRIIATQLGIGDRAEAYLRFPAGPQNMLTLPHAPGLGPRKRARVGGGRAAGVHQAGQRRRQLLPLPDSREVHAPGSRRR